MFDVNAKNARLTLAAIEERIKRRHNASTTIALVHNKEIPLIKAALEEFAANYEANNSDVR